MFRQLGGALWTRIALRSGIALILITWCIAASGQNIAIHPSAEPGVHLVVQSDGTVGRIVLRPGETRTTLASDHDLGIHIESHRESAPDTWKYARLPACVDDWTNSGGNAGRYGHSDEIGPGATGADQLWGPVRPSLIAYQPVIADNRVFTVRMKEFGNSENPDDSPVVAIDLHTGEELWFADLPNNPGDWTTWIAGVRNGLVFASRSGNGASVAAKLYALNAATGEIVWDSDDTITAGPYDGVVFAPDGDPIIGSRRIIMRIDAETGATVWDSPRSCSVTSSCGAAISGNAVYVVEPLPLGGGTNGGHAFVRFDLETGQRQYRSPAMGEGFLTVQNTPMAWPDGSVYLSRTMNNVNYDFFFAFSDTGTEFVEKWNVPAAWTAHSEFGLGLDGSVYMIAPGYELVRLDPSTGQETANSGPLGEFNSPRIAIDGLGNVFLSNGEFADGRLYAFTPDLTPIWDVPIVNINIGGPAIGRVGTLVVFGVGTNAKAYRLPDATLACTRIMTDGFESGNFSGWSNNGIPEDDE